MRTTLYAIITMASFIGADTALDRISADTAFHLSVPQAQQVELEQDRVLMGSTVSSGFTQTDLGLAQGNPGPYMGHTDTEEKPLEEGDKVMRCLDGSCCTELEYHKERIEFNLSIDLPSEVIRQCLKK